MPVMIEETAEKGKGLIASRNFKMGDLIFKERAVSTIRSQGKEAGLEILSQLNQMTADERSDFYNLTRKVLFISINQIKEFKQMK